MTLSDLLAVNGVLAQPVTAANFLRGLDTTGALSGADVLYVNRRLTHVLPPP